MFAINIIVNIKVISYCYQWPVDKLFANARENLNFNSLPLQLLMLLTVSVSISSFPFSSSFQLAASGLAFQTLVPPGLCDACRRGLISRVKVYWFLTLSWATSGFVRLSSARCGEVKLLPVPVTQTTPQGGLGDLSNWSQQRLGECWQWQINGGTATKSCTQ